MGILNATPDSFYDGGQFNATQKAVDQVGQMLLDGLDILDLGAVSTRPQAAEVSEEEELDRLLEILEGVKKNYPDLPISIDTFRSKVAQQTIAAGAHIINDISGGTLDSEMFNTVAQLKVPYILMHIQGTPQTMQQNPVYKNVVAAILEDLGKKTQELINLGVDDIIIDPGFGFGKTVAHNFKLLKQLEDFKIIEMPIMVGISRKSMINKVLKTHQKNALNGTTALHAWALEKGANILRVHDVKEARQVVTLYQELNSI